MEADMDEGTSVGGTDVTPLSPTAQLQRDLADARRQAELLQFHSASARRGLTVSFGAIVVAPALAMLLFVRINSASVSVPMQQALWAAAVLVAYLEYQSLSWWAREATKFWRMHDLRGKLTRAVGEAELAIAEEASASPGHR